VMVDHRGTRRGKQRGFSPGAAMRFSQSDRFLVFLIFPAISFQNPDVRKNGPVFKKIQQGHDCVFEDKIKGVSG